MSINWFPGHMHKARKEIAEVMPQVDVIIEMLDARIPFSSENPLVPELRGDTPVIKVLNKADLAEEATILALRANHPDAVVVSARTGKGIDELREVLEDRLPRPEVEVTALVPYTRGDLVDRIHKTGVIDTLEHTGDGTLVTARVRPDLADELAEFVRG